MFVIIGWLVVLGCVFGVFIVHGGNMAVILKALPWEMLTIGGATLGAFLANDQMKVVKATMKGLGSCFKGSKYTKARYMEMMTLLFDILQMNPTFSRNTRPSGTTTMLWSSRLTTCG